MLQYIRDLLSRDRTADETGASAVEYGLLVGGIAALIVFLVFAIGGNVQSMFQDTCDGVSAHGGTSCTETP